MTEPLHSYPKALTVTAEQGVPRSKVLHTMTMAITELREGISFYVWCLVWFRILVDSTGHWLRRNGLICIVMAMDVALAHGEECSYLCRSLRSCRWSLMDGIELMIRELTLRTSTSFGKPTGATKPLQTERGMRTVHMWKTAVYDGLHAARA